MKKIALSSLIAVFAVSGAHAANVIDGNPLYMPKAHHFYSVTDLETSTRNVDAITLGEQLGYGVSDKMTVLIGTSLSQEDWFETGAWNDMELGLAYRFADQKNWKWDVMANYKVSPVLGSGNNVQHRHFMHGRFLDKDDTMYTWTVGVRGGYTTPDFTIAGHVMMDYENTKSFNWDQDRRPDALGLHTLRAGLDAQVVLNKSVNLVSGAEYQKQLDHYSEVLGSWKLLFGANYNIDATKFVGAYITKDVTHTKAVADGTWELQDGFGLGAKFGIDF
jgi:opacity protein-like surface antigen